MRGLELLQEWGVEKRQQMLQWEMLRVLLVERFFFYLLIVWYRTDTPSLPLQVVKDSSHVLVSSIICRRFRCSKSLFTTFPYHSSLCSSLCNCYKFTICSSFLSSSSLFINFLQFFINSGQILHSLLTFFRIYLPTNLMGSIQVGFGWSICRLCEEKPIPISSQFPFSSRRVWLENARVIRNSCR